MPTECRRYAEDCAAWLCIASGVFRVSTVGQYTVRVSIFRAFLGVIERTNVALRVYLFAVHFYFRLVNYSQQRVLATPFALLANVAYRIASHRGHLCVCYFAELGGSPCCFKALYHPRQLHRILFPSVFGFHCVSMKYLL